MRKWGKKIGTYAVCIVLALVAFNCTIKTISSSAWARKQLITQISRLTGREVRVGTQYIDYRGLHIGQFELAETGGFEKGTALSVPSLRVGVSWLHLLHGHLKINTLILQKVALRVIRKADGTLNWAMDNLSGDTQPVPSDEPADEPFELTARMVSLEDIQFSFIDEATRQQFDIADLDVLIRNFRWDDFFDVRLAFPLVYQTAYAPLEGAVGLSGRVHLANLDLTKAVAQLHLLTLRRGDTRLAFSGNVENFEKPAFSVKLDGKKISSDMLAVFGIQPIPFAIEKLQLIATGTADPQGERITLSDLLLTLPGVDVKASGFVAATQEKSWVYNYKGDVAVDVKEMALNFPTWRDYHLAGWLTAHAEGTHKEGTADLTLAGGGIHLRGSGIVEKVQASLHAREKMDLSDGDVKIELNGVYNKEPFEMNFMGKQTPEQWLVALYARGGKISLPAATDAPEPPAEDEPQFALDTSLGTPQKSWQFPPISAKADVKIDFLKVPYFEGKNVVFTADVQGITPDLKTAHGPLSLQVGNGRITDLYHLTEANALTKVLFLSLNVVGKVFNSLNVLSVLGGLGGSSTEDTDEPKDRPSAVQTVIGPDGEEIELPVPDRPRKMQGQLVYEKLETDINFVHGVADIQRGSFVSDTVSMRLDGTTDFNTDKLDLTVQAAPGQHEADGFMPLQLKIGGTVSDPQGNMSVLGSVSSLVTQSLTHNVATQSVKKGVSGLINLFKKKDSPEEKTEP